MITPDASQAPVPQRPARRVALRAAPVVLVTGFEPFAGEPVNPSQQVAMALHGLEVAGHAVVGAVLPCRFGASRRRLDALLQRHRPRLVVALGQAARPEISVERVAINVDDARIADNAQRQPVDRPVIRGAPAAYFATLPIKAVADTLRRAGLPAQVSQTAGTFVCNHVFYALMHRLATDPAHAGVRGGFVHLPLLDEQAQRLGGVGMPLPLQVAAVRLALLECLQRERDLRLAAGAVD